MSGRRRASGKPTLGLGGPRRRGVIVGAVVAGVLVVGGVAGVAVAATNSTGGATDAAASSSASAAPSSSTGSSAGSSTGSSTAGRNGAAGFQDPAAPAARSDATPVRVTIPAIGVSSSLEDLHRGAAGELDPPKDWDSAGWFSDGIVPGEVGPAVIAGHVDSPTAAAVFFRLDELVPGDAIHVAMSDGSTRTFTVERSERAAKSAFPTSDVYGTAPTPQLRLITCDGTFDTATGHYTDNLIVFAELSSD
ncbi:class F sortase [Curtobacterium sp. NPDC098951]|uniref:class F sortase n=1 Tax=Curtobacterium sp. NPDC098951 TaxID=3363974 RepID=UPI00381D434C